MNAKATRHSFLEAKSMSLFIRILGSISILVVGVLTFYLYGQKPEIETDDEGGSAAGVLVETVELTQFDQPITIEFDGEATTFRVITVGAEVAGRIEKKSDKARSGHFVKKGDLLFKIDRAEYALKVQRQQAELEQIDAEISSLNIELDNLATLVTIADEDRGLQQNHLDRTRRLFERQATSDSALDDAIGKELVARNVLQKLKNDLSSKNQNKAVTQARRKVEAAVLKQAELDLARCVITAPIAGRIADDQIEEGNFAAVGQTLAHISDSSRMEVRCQLQASELAWIWKQQFEQLEGQSPDSIRIDPIEIKPVPCEVVYEFSGIETSWQGMLTRFEGTGMSRETRTFPARILVENPQQTTSKRVGAGPISVTPPTLLSGMFVTVRIPLQFKKPLLSVPVEAVRPGGKLWLNDNGTLKIQNVTVAKVIDSNAILQLSSKLKIGDRVITSPLAAVAEGMVVREPSEEQEQASSDSTKDEEEVQL